MKEINNNFVDAKMLAHSIVDSLDTLFLYSTMYSSNTLDDRNKIDGMIFTIRTAAEKLSQLTTELESKYNHNCNSKIVMININTN